MSQQTEPNQPQVEPQQFHFQSLSWFGDDYIVNTPMKDSDESDDSEPEPDSEPPIAYNVCIHGRTKTGESVCLRVPDFTPYFYVEIPEKVENKSMFGKKLVQYIKERLRNLAYGLTTHQVAQKKKLYPFTNEKEFTFVRLVFSSMKAFKYTRTILNKEIKIGSAYEKMQYNLYETNVDPINRLCHVRDISTTGHIVLQEGQYETDNENFSNADIQITTSYKNLSNDKTESNNVNFSILSWDIECQSHDGESFPNYKHKDDFIGQIGLTLSYLNTNEKKKFIVTHRPCANFVDSEQPEQQVTVISNNSERDLLTSFCNILENLDPDFIVGYNTWGFDDVYLYNRLMLYNLMPKSFSRITKVPESKKTSEFYNIRKAKLQSSAYGDNEFDIIACHGRETFDLLISIRKDHKLASYKLDEVGKHFTKQQKEDMPYRELFKKINGSPAEVAEVAKYCVQDTNLVIEIVKQLSIFQNHLEMANVTCVPASWLLVRGQQCKVFSLVLKEARIRNYVVPVKIPGDISEFIGATVLQPRKGCYYNPVAGLDFASLYPSIMIAFNMCYSTIVIDKKYMNLPGVHYESIKIDDGITITFVQNKIMTSDPASDKKTSKEVGKIGILPSILQNLWLGRKETKKKMSAMTNQENYKESGLYKVLNGKQLAQKVTMNSVYGFTGAKKGMLPCLSIACSVTAKGRMMIEQTSALAQEMYPCTTLYGDSIPGYEVITVGCGEPAVAANGSGSQTSFVELPIESFCDWLTSDDNPQKTVGWSDYRMFKIADKTIFGKEQINLEESTFFTQTHKGQAQIKRIIRHKTEKMLYKIKTKDKDGNIHEVVVTGGHSLIDENGELVAAEKLTVGTKLYS